MLWFLLVKHKWEIDWKLSTTKLFIFSTTTAQQGEDYSRYNVDRAQAEMKGSRTLRETIHHTQNQAKNDLEAQRDATEYAFRKRMHDFERAIDELDWQKKNVRHFLLSFLLALFFLWKCFLLFCLVYIYSVTCI